MPKVFKVVIKNHSNDEKIPIKYKDPITVGDVKNQVSQSKGIGANTFYLSCGGRALDDSEYLYELRLDDEKVLKLFMEVKLCGGGKVKQNTKNSASAAASRVRVVYATSRERPTIDDIDLVVDVLNRDSIDLLEWIDHMYVTELENLQAMLESTNNPANSSFINQLTGCMKPMRDIEVLQRRLTICTEHLRTLVATSYQEMVTRESGVRDHQQFKQYVIQALGMARANEANASRAKQLEDRLAQAQHTLDMFNQQKAADNQKKQHELLAARELANQQQQQRMAYLQQASQQASQQSQQSQPSQQSQSSPMDLTIGCD